ncbi:unnamed protein product [Lymnaea stagnalis]|uniref:G-protein coupled receptors family 1 profile domain-containing protein n=1 Tax=Lymnaea stagnalis TaxID=6523 RepID=A0AAV2HXR9_LYMST
MNAVSDEVLYVFMQVNDVVVSAIIGFLGIVFNLINIAVFVTLGLSDTTNISLLGLAVADIGVSLTMFGYGVVNNPLVLAAAPHVDIIDAVNYVVLGAPHVMFSRIAGCLTAFVTVERFLCISLPLHVKTIVTRRRISLAVGGVYVLMVVSTVPTFIANQIGPRFNSRLNLTTDGLVLSWNSDQLESVTLLVNIVVQMTSFCVVIVSTLGLIRSLVRMSQWRSASSSTPDTKVSSRDKQLVKMVLTIAVVFIACSLPIVVGNLVMVFVKDFSVKGNTRNLFILVIALLFLMDSINSTVNIFMYLKMSSRFRETFLSFFSKQAQ